MRALSPVLVVVALFTACASKPDDGRITRDIQTDLSRNSITRESQVDVQSRQGKVTLRGKAPTQSARREIERIARQERGVVAVDDETVVETPPTAAQAEPDRSLPNSSEPFAATPGSPSPAASASQTPTTSLPPPPPPVPPPAPKPVVVPSGTLLTIRTDQALGSKESQVGHSFSGSLATPITIDGKMVIPSGSSVTGIVRRAKKAGRFKGGAELHLALDSVTVSGHKYNIETEDFSQASTGKGKRTAGLIGGGTGLGAAIGGLAGGGAGAAIGALSGAAAGTVGAGATGNKRDINFPAESALSFKLTKPLKLKPMT
jgi:hypothetical protein